MENQNRKKQKEAEKKEKGLTVSELTFEQKKLLAITKLIIDRAAAVMKCIIYNDLFSVAIINEITRVHIDLIMREPEIKHPGKIIVLKDTDDE